MAGEERSEEDGREIMMRDFWNLIHRNYEGSIPAGFIFLPGERLSIPAFGWAPRTWMSGKDEDHPYPLSMVGKPTELHQEGLLVHYPGFLLHCGDARMVLGTDKASDWELTFPTDKSLTERYRATNTKELGRPHVAQKVRLCEGSDFGIILSSPKPGESPPEIGLLVEIYNEMWRRKEPERVNKKIYCCQIIRRVVVCRISDASTLAAGFHLPSGKLGQPPIGELMPEDTMWFVDGYLDSKIRKDFLRPRTPIKAEDKIGSVTFGSLSAVKANALNPRTPTVSPPVSTPTTNGNSSPKVEPNQEEKGGQADPNTVNNIVKWLTRW